MAIPLESGSCSPWRSVKPVQMKPALANIVARCTARRGNHPALWLIFGGIGLVSFVQSLFNGRCFVWVPSLWKILARGVAPRLEEIRYDVQPILFVGWLAAVFAFSALFLFVGCAALVLRAQARKQASRFGAIIER